MYDFRTMKNFIKRIIILKLDLLAKLYLWRFKPEIIAITGNVGKTSTKEAISAVMARIKTVRFAKGNLNNELPKNFWFIYIIEHYFPL